MEDRISWQWSKQKSQSLNHIPFFQAVWLSSSVSWALFFSRDGIFMHCDILRSIRTDLVIIITHFNVLIESKHLRSFATEENDNNFMSTGRFWELFKATLTFQSISLVWLWGYYGLLMPCWSHLNKFQAILWPIHLLMQSHQACQVWCTLDLSVLAAPSQILVPGNVLQESLPPNFPVDRY